MKEIQSVARGKPERAYAKWLVLHHVWNLVSSDIGSGDGEWRFRFVKEQSDYDVLYPLVRAIDEVFGWRAIHLHDKRKDNRPD